MTETYNNADDTDSNVYEQLGEYLKQLNDEWDKAVENDERERCIYIMGKWSGVVDVMEIVELNDIPDSDTN